MKYLFLLGLLSLISSNAFAYSSSKSCFDLEPDRVYEVQANQRVCFKTNLMEARIFSIEDNITAFKVGLDNNHSSILFPSDSIAAHHAFYLEAPTRFYITVKGNNVGLVDENYISEKLPEMEEVTPEEVEEWKATATDTVRLIS